MTNATHNLCTVSDYKFLAKGLTLYESLKATSKDFVLHYLCVDDETYGLVKTINEPTIEAHRLEHFVQHELALSVSDRHLLIHLFDTERKYFLWTLASCFSNHLMKTLDVPITYIDADIYFHHSINEIIDKIDKDVGVFRHRQFPLDYDVPSGLFNVGVVHFKNTKHGKTLLSWWADCVLHQRFKDTLGQCGDQKYLDAFYWNARDYLWIDGDVGHGAPWLWRCYKFDGYVEYGYIIWNGVKQKLYFTHFSQFEYDAVSYIPSTMHHIYTPLNWYKYGALKTIYNNYFHQICNTHHKYKIPLEINWEPPLCNT